MDKNKVKARIKKWLLEVVIGLNLCPFAKRPYHQGLIHIAVSYQDETQAFLHELLALNNLGPRKRATTLLTLPKSSMRFSTFLKRVDLCEQILKELQLESCYQVVAFHPYFRMGKVAKNSAAHWVNRCPFPLIHIIRSEEIALLELDISEAKAISRANSKTIAKIPLPSRRKLFL